MRASTVLPVLLGAPPAIANAVVDALRHLGVTHIDIPILSLQDARRPQA